jgi:hypothetical protein
VLLAGESQVAAFPGQHRLVSGSQLAGGLDERVVDLPVPPIQLIDGPRGDRRLGEFLDVRRAGAGAPRDVVACRGEFIQGQLVQAVEVVL